ncbi:alpha/beta hydrolase [Rossellomorea sp. DA94]|uniref:alpha/beta hydrolase n=1 Tax=Rossellomorea sp. DA94 TaxID=3038653 RepID=UPI00244BC96D|nr:alpha/beta hydrolase [Rossellomorea sp. DA94]WGG46400.1 alpha/beta hydrolase [Rossellomorea sp. DA94]
MYENNLEYRVIGEGKQVLVFETGIGNSFYSWLPFVKRVKNDFTVILYHRAGYGESGTSTETRTTANIARELNGLMEHLQIERFLIAGHSFGGLCAQAYARMYPEKLDGLLLIDATSHNFQRLYDLNLPVMYSMISLELLIEANEENAGKSRAELEEWYKERESELSDEEEAFLTNPVLYQTIADEFTSWSTSSDEIKSGEPFPDIPLIAIARDEALSAKPYIEYGIPEEEALLHEKVWSELQVELAQLSEIGELVIAEGSDHEVHKDQPEIVVECLQRLKEGQVPGFK